MTRRGAAVFFLAIAVLSSGCRDGDSSLFRGNSAEGNKNASAQNRTEDGKAGESSKAKGSSSSQGNATPDDLGSDGGTGSGSDAPENRMRVSIEIPECLEKGRPASATVRADAASLLGMAVEYEGYSEHADWSTGVTGADGAYKWVWTIPAKVPSGNAIIVALAQSADGGKSGHARERFRVAAPGECR